MVHRDHEIHKKKFLEIIDRRIKEQEEELRYLNDMRAMILHIYKEEE